MCHTSVKWNLQSLKEWWGKHDDGLQGLGSDGMMTLVLQELLLFSAADRRVASASSLWWGPSRRSEQKTFARKDGKKDTTEKVKWEFNSANGLRAAKVTNGNSRRTLIVSLFSHLFCSFFEQNCLFNKSGTCWISRIEKYNSYWMNWKALSKEKKGNFTRTLVQTLWNPSMK